MDPKKAIELFAWAKCSPITSVAEPNVDKSGPVGGASISDLLKMNFLSSPSACFKLVDHIHQVGNVDTFSSLSFEKQKETPFHLLKKVVFFAETI